MDHFTYGALTPLLSFALSCAGCGAGLSCTARARVTSGVARTVWLLLGSVAIGGTGIWVMHFVAMLGFSVQGAQIRYDVSTTIASMLLAVAVVGVGLFLVHRPAGGTAALLTGGIVAGLGIAVMHYLGMAAMHVGVDIAYDPLLVVTSVVIAMAAATGALWLSARVRGAGAGAVATVVMGLAVSGMHYTGMAAMRITSYRLLGTPIEAPVTGLPATQFLVPLMGGIVVGTVALLIVAAAWPTAAEMEAQAEFDAWTERQRERQRSARRWPARPGYHV
ncbi:MHYT domain-containing protein [Myceligenerans xiligouense]|uniref:NO-binding membrane sensor protein with MHYT domain n=1 Tax=Myceligenerans xiligouense TaxID=253184 RepID=A0A3N4YKX0_9MICO|nr:MHYT domain-containing protein [Myceligenerans xiligouense]RPF21749.1 NO-binding membrane sensor protein with MHYT domain [Myceligenerans xiligouense]